MEEKQKNKGSEKKEEQTPLPEKVMPESREEGKTEVKNANAAGQGAIGRSGEKPGPDMNEQLHY